MNSTEDHGEELLLSQLPKTEGWLKYALYLYEGFWYPSKYIPNIVRCQEHFQAQDQDIILASFPKTGTTWLKALLFSTVNRDNMPSNTSPLLSTNPHTLVPYFEIMHYANATPPDLSGIPSPRLFSTHVSYTSLPDSIKRSKTCKIVYICRNPLDVLVSNWYFLRQQPEWSSESQSNMEEYVEKFCKGEHGFGPFWNHMLEYWKKSLEEPGKVLFLKYEDIKEYPVPQVKKLADFAGFPFSEVEESKGVIERILEVCSLTNLRDLDVNKTGKAVPHTENKSLFRKGEVGDWVNHLSPSMVESIQRVFGEKLCGSGLTFKRSNG